MADYEGTAGADTYVGGADRDQINGNAGNDSLSGGGGNDNVFAGDGDDDVHGGEGDDYLVGGKGQDAVFGDIGNDELFGLDGDDTLVGGLGADTLRGSIGSDQISGDAGNDVIYGDDFTSFAGDGNDLIDGGDGNDNIQGGGGRDEILGGSGNDEIRGGAGMDTVFGGDGDDFLDGFGEYGYGQDTDRDSIYGGTGDDHITVGFGDSADGGADRNVLTVNFYAGATAGVTIDFRQLTSNGSMTVGGATIQNFDYVPYISLTPFDDDVTAGPGNGVQGVSLDGWGGNDRLVGSSGRDYVYGGDGDDVIYGGIGIDPSVYPSQDRLMGEAGNDTIYTDVDGALVSGGNGDDRLIGGAGDDDLNGDSGNDLLQGGGGNDGLQGWGGADTFLYVARGFGDDVITDLTSGDRIDLSALGITSFDELKEFIVPHGTLYSSPATTSAVELRFNGELERIALLGRPTSSVGAPDFVFDVSSAGRTVEGNAGADILFGGNGSDTIRAGGGNDVLVGSIGADMLDGGAAEDIVSYAGSAAAVTVNLTTGMGQGGSAEGDRYTAIENVRGSIHADQIMGDALANRLDGGGGNDTLSGFAGEDNLTGGGGNDLLNAGEGSDLLNAGEGDDLLDGGANQDVAIFSGIRSKYSVSAADNGDILVSSATEGADRLHDVELLRFADGTYIWDPTSGSLIANSLPVFSGGPPSLNVAMGGSVGFTVSASDANGDPLTYTVSVPTKGSTSVVGNAITYIPKVLASGADSFVVTAADDKGGTATQTISVTIAPGPLPPSAFQLISATGKVIIGGNGGISGTNGIDDVSLLYGAISLDGSFNRGGDIIRLAGNAGTHSIARSGSSTAIITDNDDLRIAIPLGLDGLITAFGDGTRKLVVDGINYKIGAQSFNTNSVPITAASEGTAPPTTGVANAQDVLIMAGTALQPGQAAHVTIGGKVGIAGSNGIDVIAIADAGGAFVFDGSFNRGGDIIVLSGNAASYSATRLGSSTMVIADANEQLTIPIGLVGLTLRFADGDRSLIFSNGKYLIGGQEIIGTTPNQLNSPGAPAGETVTRDTAGTETLADDALAPSADAATMIDNILSPASFVLDHQSAMAAAGGNFIAFG